ncbi:MAG: hypothetical protein AAF514_11305 [Verrucomicrobiota bacterium]
MVPISALKALLPALLLLVLAAPSGARAQDGVLGRLEAIQAGYAERLKRDQEKARKAYLKALDKLQKERKSNDDPEGARTVEAEKARIAALIEEGPFTLLKEIPASAATGPRSENLPGNHLSLALADAQLKGGVQYHQENGLLRWRHEESEAVWTSKNLKKGHYQLEIAYTTTDRKAAGQLKISLERPKKSFQPELKPGRNRLEVGSFHFPGGDLKLRFRFAEIPHRAFRLRGIRLIPVD